MLPTQECAARYLSLVRRLAYRLARRLPPHVLVDDLISAGCVGLLDALDKFDPTRVERFEQYAEYRIRGAMLDALRALDLLTRDTRGRANKLADTIHALAQELGRLPEEHELAQALGCTVEVYRQLLEDLTVAQAISLDDLTEEGAAPADAQTPDPLDAAEHRQKCERLARAIAQLSERHQFVLMLYYVHDLRLHEIGNLLGVTESRACQLLAEAHTQLREMLADLELPEEETTQPTPVKIQSG